MKSAIFGHHCNCLIVSYLFTDVHEVDLQAANIARMYLEPLHLTLNRLICYLLPQADDTETTSYSYSDNSKECKALQCRHCKMKELTFF